MRAFSQIFFATLAGVLILLPNSEALRKPKTEYSQLTFAEKLMVQILYPDLAKSLHVNKHQGESPLRYDGAFEVLFLDGPTYFQMLAGFGNSVPLPDVYYEFFFEWCFISCTGRDDIYDLKGIEIQGTQAITLKTSINGTRIRVEYDSPKVQLHGPSASISLMEMPYDTRINFHGLDVTTRNYTFGFAGDLVLGSEGLRLSNVSVHFGLGEAKIASDNVTLTFQDGSRDDEELGPMEMDYAEDIRETIEDMINDEDFNLKERMTIWFNCFLSNGESGDSECAEYLSDRLHKQSFIQIVHGIGLGQLLQAN